MKVKNQRDKQSLPSDGKGKSEDKVHQELDTVKGMLARDRERQDLGKIASVGIIARLIPVLDNLESAQAHLQDAGLAISIVEFKKVLSEEGLTEIKPNIGSAFDHETMEAIEVVPGESDNSIAELVLAGWKYEDGTVVRHAKVKVVKK